MKFPNKEIVKKLKNQFPEGCRVELVKMDDTQAPPIGTKGTVKGVDDTGSIMVSWDNGSSLNVVYGEDKCKKLDSVRITCYNETKIWDSREEAIEFFQEGIANSEGSECERYLKICEDLKLGMSEVDDEYWK